MPIYEYDCPDCGRIEVLQKINARALKECPQCAEKGRKNKVDKAVSPAAFHLKGSGWYKTDYASKSNTSSASSSSKPDSTKSEKSESGEKTAKEGDPSSKTTTEGKKTETKSSGCGSKCGCH